MHSGARAAARPVRGREAGQARDDLDRLGARARRPGTTPTRTRSPPGSRPSPETVGSAATSAPPWVPIRPPAKPTLAWSFDQAAHRRRGRHRRLVRPADQPAPATVDAAGVSAATRARRPSNAATARSKARWPSPRCSCTQSPHHRVDHRDLPGPADLLPGRAAGPPSAGPAGRDADRPARLQPPGQTPRGPSSAYWPTCADPRPRRRPRHHPQTRRHPSPSRSSTSSASTSADPLVHPVKPYVRGPGRRPRCPIRLTPPAGAQEDSLKPRVLPWSAPPQARWSRARPASRESSRLAAGTAAGQGGIAT